MRLFLLLKTNKHLLIRSIVLATILLSSCKKNLELDPPFTSTNGANVYNNDQNAAAVLTGIYIKMSQSDFRTGGIASMSLFPALSADELTLFDQNNTSYAPYYRNELSSIVVLPSDFWLAIYPIIFTANAAIEGLAKTTSLTPSVREQLLGEALFIRAFCYFQLVNLYGDVPLPLTTDYEVNRLLARAPQLEVWQQIVDDLKAAQTLLKEYYLQSDAQTVYQVGSEDRVRPTKWAATALLARSYLYTQDWVNAENEASAVINNTSFFNLEELDKVFLMNSREAIWQLQPVRNSFNTQDAFLFMLPLGPNSDWPVHLSNDFINSLEVDDQRKSNWIGVYTDTIGNPDLDYYYAYKYKAFVDAPLSEYTMVLRLGEQYLIRAEARARQNNISGAQSDLNMIRSRAGLPASVANDQPTLLNAILQERRIELFTEWGHRWLDLKRTGQVDIVMTLVAQQKGASWNSNWQWYPIPNDELLRDPNLTQNQGY